MLARQRERGVRRWFRVQERARIAALEEFLCTVTGCWGPIVSVPSNDRLMRVSINMCDNVSKQEEYITQQRTFDGLIVNEKSLCCDPYILRWMITPLWKYPCTYMDGLQSHGSSMSAFGHGQEKAGVGETVSMNTVETFRFSDLQKTRRLLCTKTKFDLHIYYC